MQDNSSRLNCQFWQCPRYQEALRFLLGFRLQALPGTSRQAYFVEVLSRRHRCWSRTKMTRSVAFSSKFTSHPEFFHHRAKIRLVSCMFESTNCGGGGLESMRD